MNVSTLQAVVTQVQEAATAVEATRAMTILVAETSAHEAVVTQDSAMILIKDVEDHAALAEREAQERVPIVVAESTVALASACEEEEGLVRKISLLEGEFVEACRA
jgi:hypothetical protein